MINIVINENFEGSVDPDVLENTAKIVLAHENKGEGVDISIAIEDNDQLQELNLKFLGVDAPTDVLSFPAEEMDPDTGHLYLGDIIISLPIALSQAAAAGHPLQNELQLLVVHGVLHLFGYDHSTPKMKTEMWKLQAQLLTELSVKISKLPED
jgi:probable rRNA maturation factor